MANGIAGKIQGLIGPKEKYSFRGKSVVITGGSRGLGLLLARQLGEEGAKLTLLARSGMELEKAEEELKAKGIEVLAFPCDVRKQSEVESAVERIIRLYGRVDVLINNAGVIQVSPLEHIELQDMQNAVDTHLWGPYYFMRAVWPHMRGQGGGRIVNIASIGGRIAVPHMLPYVSSKHALVGLSDGMRSEFAKDKILITTVSPGLIRTGSPPNALFKGQNKKEYAWFAIGDGMPGLSMDAARCASQIIEACRKGQPELTTTFMARFGSIMNILFPNFIGRILVFYNKTLPKPTNSAEGNQTRSGWDSQSKIAPSPLTTLSDEATKQNNEVG